MSGIFDTTQIKQFCILCDDIEGIKRNWAKLLGMEESSRSGSIYRCRSTFERPAALPAGYLGIKTYANEEESALAL